LGWAKLPQNVEWKQILGMGTLAGIGFTMSIFTTALAFKDESARDIAKIAILLSVVTSLVVSWVYFILAEKISAKYSINQTATKHTPEMAMG
jgi:Na+:H+ antiporter, NhaA family